mgnify:CR=1 FL=1
MNEQTEDLRREYRGRVNRVMDYIETNLSEPLTLEDVLEIIDKEKPKGVIVPRAYPVTARAVAASGKESRLTPSSARSFGHEIWRPPGTRTNR